MKSTRPNKARRGVVTPLVAILLVPLLVMMAFSIDIGYAVEVRAELVNATDAAALAGVQQLYGPYRQWLLAVGNTKTNLYNNAITSAKATATAVANSNRAAGSPVQLVAGDVDVGYTDATGTYYSGNKGNIPASAFPNTVIVTARRDNTNLPTSNGEVQLFFGSVIGKNTLPLTATATAMAYEGSISDFKSTSGVNGSLLPVAVDKTQWTDFYQNGVNSAYADPNAPAGTAWLQIYPGGTGSSMDGLLSLDGTKAASQQYYSGSNGWVEGGPSSTDITGLHSSGDLPLPASGTGQTWASGPGMKSSLLSDFQSVVSVGGVRLLPIFDPNSPGTTGGGNGTYQIDYFVPVIMVYADGHGKANMDIAVIPALGSPVIDPTAVIGNIAPMGTSSVPRQYTVPVAAKLAQ